LKKRIMSLSLFLVSIILFSTISFSTVDAYAYKTVYFSNLSSSSADGATQYYPGSPSTMRHAVTGIVVDNVVYVKASDFCYWLGVDFTFDELAYYEMLTIWGNGSPEVCWYKDFYDWKSLDVRAQYYGISEYYSVATSINKIIRNTYPMTDGTVTSQSNQYVSFGGDMLVSHTVINDQYYVPARLTALSLGALVYQTGSTYDTIYDYRVNSGTQQGMIDDNHYIVGGNWLPGWSSEGTVNLAPHFTVNEFWSKNTGDSQYLNQLKISTEQLSIAELVRKYYRNNLSLGIDPGFRGWNQNYNTSGAAKLSWHTRGRAWDSDNIPASVQQAVWKDFSVTDTGYKNTSPILVSGSVYRTWKSSMQEISLASEIEGGTTWLHLQTDPRYIQSSHVDLP